MIGMGEFKNRITIMKASFEDNGAQVIEVFEEYKTVWAKVVYISASEKLRAAAVQHNISLKFIIRDVDITNADQIKFKDEMYEISGIRPIARTIGFMEVTAGLLNGI